MVCRKSCSGSGSGTGGTRRTKAPTNGGGGKCVDGDVRVASGTTLGAGKKMYPEVHYKGKWYPVCGHYFWDNHHGATTFCKQLGFTSGTQSRTRAKFKVDAMPVGKCNAGQKFNKCNQGGHAWGNLNYRNGWCKAGKAIGVSVSRSRALDCGTCRRIE